MRINPEHDHEWPALYESEDLNLARAVATCVASMEYEVRLRSDVGAGAGEGEKAYIVHVPAEHLGALLEVIDEIVDEQQQFDDVLDRWHGRPTRKEQRLMIAMIVVIGALALAGALEL